MGRQRSEVGARASRHHRASSARSGPPGCRGARALPSVPSIERPVDRQRALLIEAGHARRARRSRRAARRSRPPRGRRRRGRPPSSPGARRTAWAPNRSAMSASIAARSSSPSIATVAPWSAAIARSVSANATSGWNAPTCVPAAIAGSEHLGSERAARVDHRLAAVHPDLAGERLDRVVRHGQDDQLDLLDEGLRLGERPGARRPAREPRPPAGVAAGDRMDRPAGPAEGEPERGPDRAGADDAGRRRLARPRALVRVGVPVSVDLAVVVAVVARRDGVEVDAGRRDRRLGLCAVALRVVARQRAPRLHRERAGAGRGPSAVRLHASSLASLWRRTRCHGSTLSAPARRSRRASRTSTD